MTHNALVVDSICSASTTACRQVQTLYETGDGVQYGDTEIFIHGGGFSGAWGIGILAILHTMETSGSMRIHMLHGYSIGAILAVCYCCDLSTKDCLDLLRRFHDDVSLQGSCREVMTQYLPEDAHLRCSGRVRIGMTRKLGIWYRECSEFSSKTEVVDALVCSSSIPGVTATMSDSVRGYIDGIFGQTVWGWTAPRFGHTGIELIPPAMGYTYVLSPNDPYVYGLIVNGLTDMIYFLQGHRTKFIRELSYMPWHVGKYARIVDRIHWSLIQRVSSRPTTT